MTGDGGPRLRLRGLAQEGTGAEGDGRVPARPARLREPRHNAGAPRLFARTGLKAIAGRFRLLQQRSRSIAGHCAARLSPAAASQARGPADSARQSRGVTANAVKDDLDGALALCVVAVAAAGDAEGEPHDVVDVHVGAGGTGLLRPFQQGRGDAV